MKKKFFFFNLETFYYSFCGPFACRPHGALVLRIFHIPRISFRLRGSHYIASRRENMKSRVKPGGRERKKEKEKKKSGSDFAALFTSRLAWNAACIHSSLLPCIHFFLYCSLVRFFSVPL